jgi:hypothetical protein
MFDPNGLRQERELHLAQLRWILTMALVAVALTLTVSSNAGARAAMSIEQVRCDPDGQAPFGLLPAEAETADVFPANMLYPVGCMNVPADDASGGDESDAIYDHGLIEPMAMH